MQMLLFNSAGLQARSFHLEVSIEIITTVALLWVDRYQLEQELLQSAFNVFFKVVPNA